MKFKELDIQGAFLIAHDVFTDDRGRFRRSFCKEIFESHGINFEVCQGNISENSHAHTLRGFHYQTAPSQESKLMSCLTGGLFNIVVDLREESDTYLKSTSLNLEAEKRQSLFVPAGCANGFLTMTDNTIVHYYMGDYFRPDSYRGFRYDDPAFNFEWPSEPAVISERDRSFPDFETEEK